MRLAPIPARAPAQALALPVYRTATGFSRIRALAIAGHDVQQALETGSGQRGMGGCQSRVQSLDLCGRCQQEVSRRGIRSNGCSPLARLLPKRTKRQDCRCSCDTRLASNRCTRCRCKLCPWQPHTYLPSTPGMKRCRLQRQGLARVGVAGRNEAPAAPLELPRTIAAAAAVD